MEMDKEFIQRVSRNAPTAASLQFPVRLENRDGRQSAHPVFGKSNLIYTMVKADGLVTVPIDANGLHAGDRVDVRLF